MLLANLILTFMTLILRQGKILCSSFNPSRSFLLIIPIFSRRVISSFLFGEYVVAYLKPRGFPVICDIKHMHPLKKKKRKWNFWEKVWSLHCYLVPPALKHQWAFWSTLEKTLGINNESWCQIEKVVKVAMSLTLCSHSIKNITLHHPHPCRKKRTRTDMCHNYVKVQEPFRKPYKKATH